MMRSGCWPGLLLLWLVALLVGLLVRPLIPVDELRYTAVAWEMWQRGDFLVPYLNGEPYSHKPPLFFWLIHAGWWLVGVNEWTVRLLAPLLTLLSLLATAHLAGKLWPGEAGIVRHAPWVMFASAFLLAFFTWVQIDLLLVLCVVLATSGLASAAHGKQTGWLLTGIALGLGLLAKGPVILLHVLPLALLAPVWKSEPPGSGWWRWYAGVLVSVCIAASIALAWALPATGAGGETYREAIFWGQTAERLVRSFAHTNPLWWYLPWLFVLFAPWICLPWLWSAVRSAWTNRDEGMRFCVTWLLTVLVLLSLVSGKQVKYLLPLLPAFALLVSRLLLQMQAQSTEQRPWLLAALLLVMGLIGVLAPGLLEQAPWLNTVHPAWGGSLIVCAAVLLWLRPAVPLQYPVRMAVLTVFVICIGELGVLRVGVPSHDLRAASRFVARAQAAGHPVAVQAHYHGEFAFYGRLQQPVVQLASGAAADWAARHPDDYLVLTGHDLAGQYPDTAFIQPYRSGELAIIRGRALIPYNGASRASE